MTSPHPVWPWPAFIAHRGGGRLAPENTLAAMRTGVAHGFRMAEYDVKLSRDGVPFLLHDDRIDRTSDGQGVAGELNWSALAQFDFGAWHGPDFAGEPAPTLLSIARYTQARGMHSNIEIKPTTGDDHGTGIAVARAAAQLWAGAALPPLLSSFSETALEAARSAAPDLPRALLIEGPVPADWRARQTGLGCIGLNIDTRHADQALVRDILDQGATLAVWTVNDLDRAHELLSWGCHAIFTDALDLLGPDARGQAH
ncbi:glycerophosphodiester phosphodiesterase [Castellaniella sp.]|uniref:glycerophosphodiester phosphodiesterase n=1 Tax=Castellaniella sp. TaxID=1955812 RepID=UPI002AFF1C24|nr:glycerophosphodiester phosphodiesterase [Castellaniella sp.]